MQLGELALLQIRDKISDAIRVSDVDENDFGSIGRRRREFNTANAEKSGETMLGYIDASNILHPNFVAALNNQPGLNFYFAVRHHVQLARPADVNVEQNENADGTGGEQQRVTATVEVNPKTKRAGSDKHKRKQPGKEEIPMGRSA